MSVTLSLAPEWLWGSAHPNPVFLTLLGVAGALYVVGVARQWRSEGAGVVTLWRVGLFALGFIVVVVTLVSPLDALSTTFFSAHVVQLLLLTTIAPPLLVAGHPLGSYGYAFAGVRRLAAGGAHSGVVAESATTMVLRVLLRPAVVAALDVSTLLIWHIPAVYRASVQLGSLHIIQVITFLLAGVLYWAVIEHPEALGRRRQPGTLACILGTSIVSSAFGLILFTSQSVWYPSDTASMAAWGLTPHDDQQVGAVLVAGPSDTVDAISFLWVFASWMRADEADAIRKEREMLARESPERASV